MRPAPARQPVVTRRHRYEHHPAGTVEGARHRPGRWWPCPCPAAPPSSGRSRYAPSLRNSRWAAATTLSARMAFRSAWLHGQHRMSASPPSCGRPRDGRRLAPRQLRHRAAMAERPPPPRHPPPADPPRPSLGPSSPAPDPRAILSGLALLRRCGSDGLCPLASLSIGVCPERALSGRSGGWRSPQYGEGSSVPQGKLVDIGHLLAATGVLAAPPSTARRRDLPPGQDLRLGPGCPGLSAGKTPQRQPGHAGTSLSLPPQDSQGPREVWRYPRAP